MGNRLEMQLRLFSLASKNKIVRRLLLYWGLVGLVFLAGLLFWVPAVKQTRQEWQQWRLKQKILRQKTEELAVLQNWDWQSLKNSLLWVQRAFPRQTDIASVLFALDAPCQRNGFLIESLRFDLGQIETATPSARKKSAPATARLDLEIVGERKNLLPFLKDLETNLPLLQPIEFSFDSQGKDAKLLRLRLSVRLYFAGHVARFKAISIKPADFVLTKGEKEVLKKLETFHYSSPQPSLSSSPSANPAGKSNIFY